MSRIRLIMLSMLAVFAVGAVAASAASAAAPEFLNSAKATPKFKCEEKTGGHGSYSTKAECEAGKETSGGKWHRFGNGFTDEEGESHFNAKGEIVFTCTADTSKGEITGAKTVGGVTVTFTGCTAKEKTNASCSANSKGEPAGTIVTNTLEGTLGEVAVAFSATEVGLALKPVSPATEFTFLEATCLGTKTTKVTGSVIGEVTPVGGPPSLTGDVIFKCASGKPTVQEIEKFVGGTKDTLTGFGTEACFESKDVNTFEEAIEVTKP